MNKIEYVIIQAGGKGTRMGKYTFNKPKALLSVDGLPLILRVFKTFNGAYFIIIADYKYDVLWKYLLNFVRDEKYTILRAKKKGTSAGIREALEYIPDNTPFILTWSDLYFDDNFKLDVNLNKNYVGISNTFPCRWSFIDGKFMEKPSKEFGVAGFFIFKSKNEIHDVPLEEEFVRYLSNKEIHFDPLVLNGVKEYGTIEEYEQTLSRGVSRPFNKVIIEKDYVEKIPLDEKGHELAKKEKMWYRFVDERGFQNIPKIISYEPLRLERISGKHPFEITPKRLVIEKIVNALADLHEITPPVKADRLSLDREYFIKTYERLYKVKNLISHSEKKEIKINNKLCPNPFYFMKEAEELLKDHYPKEFRVIHGDPTFSNILMENSYKVYFIDPRGYFGYEYIYGDPDYDFAKLYYSMVGNYDRFNRKRFMLKILENEVELNIESSGYEEYEDLFFEMIGKEKKSKIKLLHAVIWLSLTLYAWDDYDMICGAFYNGALKFREVLEC